MSKADIAMVVILVVWLAIMVAGIASHFREKRQQDRDRERWRG